MKAQELVAVVDEHDNVLSTKPRADLMRNDIVRVSVLWIENSQGQVLLQQRALTKAIGPGQWGPAVAGTVEAHETYDSNIVKEAEEELGLRDITPIPVAKRLYWEPDGRFGRMYMFYRLVLDRPSADFIIRPQEVAQVKWVEKPQLLRDLQHHSKAYVPSAVLWEEMYYRA